jgi:hypothetical protein
MKTYLLAFLLFLNPIKALISAELTPAMKTTIIENYKYLVRSTHSELDTPGLKMSFYSINNPEYFMESNFKFFQRIIRNKKVYKIGVNPLIFKKKIPAYGLLAVMAHEMMHTVDYESGKILRVGYYYLRGGYKKRSYERGVDLRVVFKGLGHHLIQYKTWQYKQLTQKALIKKKKEYLTPEEINFIRDAIEQVGYENKTSLKKYFLMKMPMDIEEFRTSFDTYLNQTM